MLFSDPWRKVDPKLEFKSYLASIIGRWRLAKLNAIFEMYKVFESDFFKKPLSEINGIEISIDDQKEIFVSFINNIITSLTKSKFFDDAEFVARVSLRIKETNNLAYWHLVLILYGVGKYKDTLKEAKLALEDLWRMEKAVASMPEDVKSEMRINNPSEYQEARMLLEATIRELENRNIEE